MLGYMVWFSVHDTAAPARMDFARTWELFEKFGLDTKHLPTRINAVFAFGKAATDVQLREERNGVTYTMKAGPTTVTGDSPSHQVWTRPLIYAETTMRGRHGGLGPADKTQVVLDLAFHAARRTEKGRPTEGHKTETTWHPHLPHTAKTMAKDWLDRFDALFADLHTNLHEDQLRKIVRAYLLSLPGSLTLNQRGGVYYVPFECGDTLWGLEAFTQEIAPDTTFTVLELQDNPKNRGTLHRLAKV